jgi:hypothetical protein
MNLKQNIPAFQRKYIKENISLFKEIYRRCGTYPWVRHKKVLQLAYTALNRV